MEEASRFVGKESDMEDNRSLGFVFMGIMIKGIYYIHPTSPQILVYMLYLRIELWLISPTSK